MLALSEREKSWLRGSAGRAMQLAMEVTVATAEAANAAELVEVEFAHIGSSFWSGRLSVDFAEFLLRDGVRFAVPTHTNTSLVDCGAVLRPPERFPEEAAGAARLMDVYLELGVEPMWSCAPYDQPVGRPSFGQQIIGSESNAVSFFNSALGARTNKYGDFLDVCGALVGRVPLVGLHTDEGRLATHVFRLDVSDSWLAEPVLPHLLGIVLGLDAGAAVPVIDGLPSADETALKAIAAAGATSGAVEMYHVVGITPEADTLGASLGGRAHVLETVIDDARLEATLAALSTATDAPIDTICLGTPHFSIDEFAALRSALDGRNVTDGIRCVATTSRAIDAELRLRGWSEEFAAAGVEVVLDTCSYYTPKMTAIGAHVMTNSAKWAYYAPGMLELGVTFASLEQCVETAVRGSR